jgi:hypothetical protein
MDHRQWLDHLYRCAIEFKKFPAKFLHVDILAEKLTGQLPIFINTFEKVLC